MKVKDSITTAIIAAATGMLQPFVEDLTPSALIMALKMYGNDKVDMTVRLEKPLTVAEACKLLQVSRPTIYRMKAQGTIRFTKVGRGTRIPAEDIKRLICAE